MATKIEYRETLYNLAWIKQKYCEEANTAEGIGKMVGCPTSTVLRALRRLEIPVRNEARPSELRRCPNHEDPSCEKEFPVGGKGNRARSAVYCSRHCHMMFQSPRATASHAPRPKKNHNTLHSEAWLREHYEDKKWSMGRISEFCNCSTPAVKWALEKFGISIRSGSEAKFGTRMERGDPKHTDDTSAGRKKKYSYEYGQAIKREMVDAYGGRCACCGEEELVFLTLDHVGGGGQKDRIECGGSGRVYRRLKKAGWPKEGYRILCWNCNAATKLGRTCPHQLKAKEVPQ